MPKFQVGDYVSIKAREFGIAWARKEFDKRWKTARVKGTIREVLGPKQYKVMYDGDDEPLESSEKQLKLVPQRKKRKRKRAARDAPIPLPAVDPPGQPFVPSLLFACPLHRTIIGHMLCCMQSTP